MVSAKPAPNAKPYSLGVGELNAGSAATANNPPNPNAALERYVGADPAGGSTPVFNSVAWLDSTRKDVSWDSVSWTDVASSDVSWGDVSWTDVSWEDAAEADVNADGGYSLTPEEAQAASADPNLAPAPDALPPEIA